MDLLPVYDVLASLSYANLPNVDIKQYQQIIFINITHHQAHQKCLLSTGGRAGGVSVKLTVADRSFLKSCFCLKSEVSYRQQILSAVFLKVSGLLGSF